MFRSRLLLAAAVSVMAFASVPVASAQAQEPLSCGQRCRLQVALEPARSIEGGLSQWVRLTVANTMSGGGMPVPLSFNPWDLRVVASSPWASPIESRMPHRLEGTTYTALANAPVVIAPNMSQSFWIEIRRLPPGANRIEILRGETALGGVAADFTAALAILNPPPPPPPSTTLPDPAKDPGFTVSPAIAAAFRGAWWTGDGTLVFGDRPEGGLAGAYYDAAGRHTGRFEIARALSTPEHLDVGLVRDGQQQPQDMILTPDGAASLIVTEKGGSRTGTMIYRARRVAGLGSRDAGPSLDQAAERLRGRWQTPFGVMTLDSENRFRGHIAAAAGEPTVWFDVAPTQDRLEGHAFLMTWGDGRTVDPQNQTYFTLSADGSRLLASHPTVKLRGYSDWEATRIVQAPPAEPTPPVDPVPPVVEPPPPTPEPVPPVPEPVPPTLPEPEPPAPQPVPPIVEPTPPVVQPTPPQPAPPLVRPTPPLPAPPPPATGAASIPGSGGFQGVSPTWDVQFDGARVERGSEIHVFVSVKNRSTSDQYVTSGTFIPNLSNQDGETITSRSVYRASGENPTEFRPTVPVNEVVRVRFIFRPETGSAQPRAFTLESFGYRKLTFDVSGLRVPGLAQ